MEWKGTEQNARKEGQGRGRDFAVAEPDRSDRWSGKV